MKTSRFNPKEYMARSFTDLEKARLVASAVASRGIDITNTYDRWVSAGFALGHSLGEQGRQVFHDISRLHPEYSAAQCDRQYDECMKQPSSGSAIGLATFFRMAEDIAGVRVGEVMREERGKRGDDAEYPKSLKSLKVSSSHKSETFMCNNNKDIDNEEIMNSANTQLDNETMRLLGLSTVDTVQATTGYTFSDKLHTEDLPPMLRRVMELHSGKELRDAMIIGVLNIVSGMLGACCGDENAPSGVFGIYDSRKVYAPLYNIIFAAAGSGKGEVAFCRCMAKPMKEEMRRRYEAEKAEYDKQIAQYEASRKKKGASADAVPRPQEPLFRTPFVAGNSSSSAVYRSIEANGGWGLMFETEADTVSLMLKSDYGNYSDLMRKAYHHETISMNRVNDNLHIDIASPRLSVMLTCTPGQLASLFPDWENGLGSRFLFYRLPDTEPHFRNVFDKCEKPLEEEYTEMGRSLMPLVHELAQRKGRSLQFLVSKSQETAFLSYFQNMVKEQTQILGREFQGFVNRIALDCFRYSMIITMLRRLACKRGNGQYFEEDEKAIVCDDRDFNTAMTIVDTLINHTSLVYARLAKENDNPFSDKGVNASESEKKIYSLLPDCEFRSADFVKACEKLDLARSSSYRILSKFVNEYSLIVPVRHGIYVKASSSASSPGENRQL